MGFLTRAAKEEEPGRGGDNEELYEKLFPKIGRDFVYKEDLERMLQSIMLVLDPLGVNPVDFQSDTAARKRALEYKAVLESGEDGSKRYRDLINLDDEEDDEFGKNSKEVSSTASGGGSRVTDVSSTASGGGSRVQSNVSSTASGGGSRFSEVSSTASGGGSRVTDVSSTASGGGSRISQFGTSSTEQENHV